MIAGPLSASDIHFERSGTAAEGFFQPAEERDLQRGLFLSGSSLVSDIGLFGSSDSCSTRSSIDVSAAMFESLNIATTTSACSPDLLVEYLVEVRTREVA